jgi:hypothetical protein
MSKVDNLPFDAQYLVYFNGVKVPAVSVNVSSGVFSPVTGTITVPPSADMVRFGAEDRVQVAVFYLDSWYDDTKPRWALLCEGFVSGFSYVNRAGIFELNFQFMSNLYILHSLFMHFMSGSSNDTGGRARPDKDYAEQLVLRGKYPNQLFTTELSGRKSIARPFDLVENLLLAVLGNFREKSFSPKVSDEEIETEVERQQRLQEVNREARIANLVHAGLTEANATAQVASDESINVARLASSLNITYSDSGSQSDLQTKILRRQAAESLKVRSRLSKSVTQTGFFARFMRLSRLLEHWVASPYIEGRPQTKQPLEAKMGGGAFPLLRSANAKKFFKAIARQTGVKYGPQGSAYGLLASVFSTLYYEIVEVMSPPAMTLDSYGLPNGAFREHEPAFDGERKDSAHFASWSANLEKQKKRPSIASYLTKPENRFSLAPACNTIFPSLLRQWAFAEDYQSAITRLYFNRKANGAKLNLGSKLPGYGYSGPRVGYPSKILRHAQDAAEKPFNDLEVLIFPEEFYKGPTTSMQSIPPLYMEIQKLVANQRFSNPLYGPPTSVLQVLDPENAGLAVEAAEQGSKKGYSAFGVYSILAQQEYFKQRFANSSGDAHLLFQPYMVPGFPVVLYDSAATGLHVTGYLNSVSHSLTQQGLSTSISMSHVRTFDQVFELLEAERTGLDMAPQEVLPEMRDLFQNMESANLYYAMLFRQGEVNVSKAKEAALASLQERLTNKENSLASGQKQLESEKKYLNTYANLANSTLGVSYSNSDLMTFSTSGLSADQETSVESIRERFSRTREETEALQNEVSKLSTTVNEKDVELGNSELLGEIFTNESSRTSVSNYKRVVGWYRDGDSPLPLVMSDSDKTYLEGVGYEEKDLKRFPSLRTKLVPLSGAGERLFNSTRAALNYVSRPVCSLEDYIDFYAIAGRGTSNVESVGRGRGIRVGTLKEEGVPDHYQVIRQFIGGPGVEPGSKLAKRAKDLKDFLDIDEFTSGLRVIVREVDSAIDTATGDTGNLQVFQLKVIGEDGLEQVVSEIKADEIAGFLDLPDSRKDWQALLLQYLNNMLGPTPFGDQSSNAKRIVVPPGG